MLFTVLLATTLGICTAQDTKTAHLLQSKNETVEKTITVLQSASVLRLHKISSGLAHRVCTCLQSTLLQKSTNGAERTLRCYLDQNSVSSSQESRMEVSTNVSIFVNDEATDPYAVLNVYNPERRVPEEWEDYYQVIYATEACFIMRTTPGKTRTAPCVLFQLDGADNAKTGDCSAKFEEKCESAAEWWKDGQKCD